MPLTDNLGSSTLIKRQKQMHELVPGQKEGIMREGETGRDQNTQAIYYQSQEVIWTLSWF